jgi:hypothetical protein
VFRPGCHPDIFAVSSLSWYFHRGYPLSIREIWRIRYVVNAIDNPMVIEPLVWAKESCRKITEESQDDPESSVFRPSLCVGAGHGWRKTPRTRKKINRRGKRIFMTAD